MYNHTNLKILLLLLFMKQAFSSFPLIDFQFGTTKLFFNSSFANKYFISKLLDCKIHENTIIFLSSTSKYYDQITDYDHLLHLVIMDLLPYPSIRYGDFIVLSKYLNISNPYVFWNAKFLKVNHLIILFNQCNKVI